MAAEMSCSPSGSHLSPPPPPPPPLLASAARPCLPGRSPFPPRPSIHEIIGRGRQSKVYKARLKQSLEYVVVKACAKDLKPRVLQEVRRGGSAPGGCWSVPLPSQMLPPFCNTNALLSASSLMPQVKVLNSMSHPNLLRFHTWCVLRIASQVLMPTSKQLFWLACAAANCSRLLPCCRLV